MSETKFTQGPWYADQRGQVRDSHRNLIADIPAGEAVATLHLIAAAPDLFDAIILALPYVEDAQKDPAYKAGAVASVVKQLRAAISKASGETK